jgi:leucyl aminopeptidase
MMTITSKAGKISKQAADAVVAFRFQDEKGLSAEMKVVDKALRGVISAVIKDKKRFSLGDVFQVHTLGLLPFSRVFIVGLGKEDQFEPVLLRGVLYSLVASFEKLRVGSVAVQFSSFDVFEDKQSASLMAELMHEAAYRFYAYKTVKKKSFDLKVSVVFGSEVLRKKLERFVQQGDVIGLHADLARDFSNEAPNVLYPDTFAKRVDREIAAAKLGSRVRVKHLDFAQIKKLGMGLIEAVGQGSVRKPRVVLVEYQGGKKSDPYYAFVGKGVTFDTGGISLKTGPAAASLTNMKRDMAGAAAVLGVVKAVAALKLRVNVVSVLCLAENMPDGGSFRPGDILTSYSGKTVEVFSTDAEGRLVMADGLAYVQDTYRVKQIVDVATLTGEVAQVFGPLFTATFTNSDELFDGLEQQGKNIGELVWRMPLFVGYEDSVEGDFADLHELSMKLPNAINSALFLKQFIRDDNAWAHLDIAGSEEIIGDGGKGSSGVGVRLLTHYLMNV